MKNATVRLAIRALLAGAAVFVSTLTAAHGAVDVSLLEGAGVAAGWAALEALTPLNSLVGYFKNAASLAAPAAPVPPAPAAPAA